MMYMVFSEAGTLHTQVFDNVNDAVNCARRKATNDRVDYQVFKLIATHYVKAPLILPAEVVDVKETNADAG